MPGPQASRKRPSAANRRAGHVRPLQLGKEKSTCFLTKAGAFLLQYQLNITTSCAGFSPGSTEMAVRTGPVESGVWPL